MKELDKVRSNQEKLEKQGTGEQLSVATTVPPLPSLSEFTKGDKDFEHEREKDRENRFQKSSYPLFGIFQQKRRKMEISYFRAFLGTGRNWETPCFLSGSYGDILITGQDIWVPLRYQVLFSLCLLSVLGAPICPYVCQFMFVFVSLFELLLFCASCLKND